MSFQHTSRTCKMSMTALKSKAIFLGRQVGVTALFLIQLAKKIIGMYIQTHKHLPAVENGKRRELLVEINGDSISFDIFRKHLLEKYPNMNRLIDMYMTTTIQLLQLESDVTTNRQTHIQRLFEHVLRQFFVRTKFFDEDDSSGTGVSTMRESLEDFLATCVNIKSPEVLTASALNRLTALSSSITESDAFEDEQQEQKEKEQRPFAQSGFFSTLVNRPIDATTPRPMRVTL